MTTIPSPLLFLGAFLPLLWTRVQPLECLLAWPVGAMIVAAGRREPYAISQDLENLGGKARLRKFAGEEIACAQVMQWFAGLS